MAEQRITNIDMIVEKTNQLNKEARASQPSAEPRPLPSGADLNVDNVLADVAEKQRLAKKRQEEEETEKQRRSSRTQQAKEEIDLATAGLVEGEALKALQKRSETAQAGTVKERQTGMVKTLIKAVESIPTDKKT